MANRIGQRLGNYRLIRLLGRGGFAEVYQAEHVFLKTQAAIKVLGVRLAKDDLNHFLEEARTIANLTHPHIVRVLEFGVHGNESGMEGDNFDIETGTPFLVMDYAPNGTLREHFPRGIALSPGTILPYVRQVAAALQFAHDRKLIHRDIKPENMLLGPNKEVLLSDFGVALIIQSTRSQSIYGMAGTVAYMAPEQLQGKPRVASDQYALGVVIYEWLCGQLPFSGSFTEVASQHILAPPSPLQRRIPDISPAVEEVVLTALAKDPNKRFASVRAFVTALEQATLSWPPARMFVPPLSATPTPGSLSTLAPAPMPSITEPAGIPTPVPPFAEIISSSAPSTPGSISAPASVEGQSTSRSGFLPTQWNNQIPNGASRKAWGGEEGWRFSRRWALIGLAGIAGLAVTGGISWFALSRNSSVPSTHPASQIGTTLYTYRGHSRAVYAVKWSPDSRRVASGGADKTVQVWDATTGNNPLIYRGHQGSTNALAWLPHDGTRLASASADKTVQVWNSFSGEMILTYHGHSNNVRALTWSPDKHRLASGGDDNTVQVWNAITGFKIFTYFGHSRLIWYVMWSPDGTRIASASEDTTVQVWDAATGNPLLTYPGHSQRVKALTWSPDSTRIASLSDDMTVQVWEASSGRRLITYRGHSDILNGVTWSPDGKQIASSGSTVQIWDASTGKHIFTYSGHSVTVHGVAWSPDGKYIASASADTTVRVWLAG